MRLLLDTHTLLFVWNHASLSATARTAVTDPVNELLLSPASFWEIAIKVRLGKLTLAMPFQAFVEQAVADLTLTVLPVEIRHAAVLTTLPLHHRDPFDRMLVAQAVAEGLTLVSGDAVFDAYGVGRVW